MATEWSFLSICPRIQKQGRSLVASTAWRLRILTLGLIYRQVVVDLDKKCVAIYRRYLWFLARRQRIMFDHIQAVTYNYEDLNYGRIWSWAHDSFDLFRVGLRLHGGEEIHLFYFFGDGTFTNDGPLPNWVYWHEFLYDLSGTQQKESRAFVDVLGKMIRVVVEPGT